MKLLRYGEVGHEKPGVLDASGVIRDLSGVVSDIGGRALLPESIERLRGLDLRTLPRVPGTPRLGPCVGQVGKFIAIGLNYSDHAAESGMAVPAEPIVFMKATSCIMGPSDDIVIPRGSQKTDWEVELGIVIGRPASYVDEADAFDHIAGYCVVNDVSERKFQLEGTGQWVKGKSADTFGPIGPWLVTTDEIARLAESTPLAGGQRPAPPERLDQPDGLRRAASGQLSQPLHEPAARRRDRHRHAARRWSRHEAAGVPVSRRHCPARHRRIGRTTPARRRLRRRPAGVGSEPAGVSVKTPESFQNPLGRIQKLSCQTPRGGMLCSSLYRPF